MRTAGRARRTAQGSGRDLESELAERYLARVNLAGIVLGVGLVYVGLLALCFVFRTTVPLLASGPPGVLVLLVALVSQSGAFIAGSRSDLPTVRSLRRRLRAGTPLSDEDVRLAEALARATAGTRTRPLLMIGLTIGVATAGGLAVWWGLTAGRDHLVGAYGIYAFAFVVQLVVVTVVARRLGRETEPITR